MTFNMDFCWNSCLGLNKVIFNSGILLRSFSSLARHGRLLDTQVTWMQLLTRSYSELWAVSWFWMLLKSQNCSMSPDSKLSSWLILGFQEEDAPFNTCQETPPVPLQLPLCCSLCTEQQGWNALLILGCLTPWLWFCSRCGSLQTLSPGDKFHFQFHRKCAAFGPFHEDESVCHQSHDEVTFLSFTLLIAILYFVSLH